MLIAPAVAPQTVLLILAAYLLGSLSGRRVFGRLRLRTDAHDGSVPHGSEPEGRGFTAARLAFDAGKGALVAWAALRYAPVADALSVTAHGYLAAFAAALGHAWPLWQRFRGGDPTVALAGGLLVLWPVGIAAWLIVGLSIWLLSGHAGLSIVAGASMLPVLAWWSGSDPPRLWFAIGAALLLSVIHRGHLWALWTGAEPRFARARRLHRWLRR